MSWQSQYEQDGGMRPALSATEESVRRHDIDNMIRNAIARGKEQESHKPSTGD